MNIRIPLCVGNSRLDERPLNSHWDVCSKQLLYSLVTVFLDMHAGWVNPRR